MPRVTILEKIRSIVDLLRKDGATSFQQVLYSGTRLEIVVTFLAVLELIKSATIELVQTEPFAPIHVRLRTGD